MSITLPSRPNLEFERKRAKKLLHSLQAGDADALQRARTLAEPPFQLSDAQLIIAREYGFSSWPKLAGYYQTWERHELSGPKLGHRMSQYETQVQGVLRMHARRRPGSAVALATFIPRFYGCTDEQIFNATLDVTEAQHVVARNNRCANWDDLVTRVPNADAERMMRARVEQLYIAMRADDFDGVKRVIEEQPDLLGGETIPEADGPAVRKVVPLQTSPVPSQGLYAALHHEQASDGKNARQITDWLVARGCDLSSTLAWMLAHCFRTSVADVSWLLDRGADPAWVAPNGLSVIEYAIMRYWNGAAVDLLAARVTPPEAFWIAAGLGDLKQFESYFTPEVALKPAAKITRPDFLAVFDGTSPRPDATDDEIAWEAFLVAGLNGRFNIIDSLISKGFPVDAAPWGGTLLDMLEGNRLTDYATELKKRGAISHEP